jgi:hypothetical protein
MLKERYNQLYQVNHLHLLVNALLAMYQCGRPAVIIGVDAISVCSTFIGMRSLT